MFAIPEGRNRTDTWELSESNFQLKVKVFFFFWNHFALLFVTLNFIQKQLLMAANSSSCRLPSFCHHLRDFLPQKLFQSFIKYTLLCSKSSNYQFILIKFSPPLFKYLYKPKISNSQKWRKESLKVQFSINITIYAALENSIWSGLIALLKSAFVSSNNYQLFLFHWNL